MNDHSPNNGMTSESFPGPVTNAEYVGSVAGPPRGRPHPRSMIGVASLFSSLLAETAQDRARRRQVGPSWARGDWPPQPVDELTSALTREWPAAPEKKDAGKKIVEKAAEKGVSLSDAQVRAAVLDSVRALMIIRAYRIRGHLVADLDPLGLRKEEPHPELDPRSYGFTEADMDRPIFLDNVLGMEVASLNQILDILKRTYCGTFALQFMHISDPEQVGWLKERIEGLGKEIAFTKQGRRAILNKLVEAEGFEKFLHVKYMGTKRFGLDGGRGDHPRDGADHQARRRAGG